MKNSQQIILVFSLFTTVMMALFVFLASRRNPLKGWSHLMEFWGAMAVHIGVIYFFLQGANPSGLILLGWLWPLRTLTLIHEDVSGAILRERWHYVIIASGGLVSFILASSGASLLVHFFPLALTIAIVGLSLTFSAFRHQVLHGSSPQKQSLLVLSGLFFSLCLGLPFLVERNLLYVLMLDGFLIVAFGGATLGLYMELSKSQYIREMETMEKARNDKLVGNSKYSELGMMAAGIAHEINNPLAVIQARTTQLLRIYRDSGKQQELADGLQQILYTSERINRTIQGVREFVHDERNSSSEIRLKDLIDDVLAFCGQRMKNHGVNLRFYGLENLSVWGNKIQLEQIILNLLNNAFDAIEYLPDKWIELSAQQNDDQVQIIVKDSGQGIPAEVAAHIMEPFYSTKDVGKGTGLGLALARGIAEKHGGTLRYQDGLGHTTFVLQIPKQPKQDWGLPLVH